MRGTVAKRLRKQARMVSKPTEQKAKWYNKIFKHNGKEETIKVCTVVNVGYRAFYQQLKRSYKLQKATA